MYFLFGGLELEPHGACSKRVSNLEDMLQLVVANHPSEFYDLEKGD